MRGKCAGCCVACLLFFGFTATVLSQDGSGTWTWGQWMKDPEPIVAFIKNYYGYMLYNIRVNHQPSDKEPGLDWGREWFAADCQMIIRPHFKYDQCETCEHADVTLWDCSCPGVECGHNDPNAPGGDGVRNVLQVFAGNHPGMIHDNMDIIYKLIGKNIWWVWTRYDYKAKLHNRNTGMPVEPEICINFPGCTILTVDMNQRRSDGGRGRITKIDISWDNLTYEKQLGMVH